MRQIKFRGLRVDGKGWVYGDFTRDETKAHITSFDESLPFSRTAPFFVVDQKTVGQFTGFSPYKKYDIYIGDIVKVSNDEYYSDENFNTGNDWTMIGEVCERDFMIGVHFDKLGFMPMSYIYNNGVYIEIIGNIHEQEADK